MVQESQCHVTGITSREKEEGVARGGYSPRKILATLDAPPTKVSNTKLQQRRKITRDHKETKM